MISNGELSPKRRALVAELLKKRGIDMAGARIPRRKEYQAEAPLSFSQKRLWFLDRLEPGLAIYNMPLAMRLYGPLDVKALQQSLDALVQRHEALRTTFAEMDGQPRQVIGPPAAVPMPIVDLRALPETERESTMLRLVYEEAQRPFDLTTGPLFRGLLLRLDQEYYTLVLTMHHIVSDAWSLELLARDAVTLYLAFASGQPALLPDLPVQYADYAVWQREWLQGKALEEQLAYWKQKLGGGLPVLNLPTDRPRPPVITHRGADFCFNLPGDLVDALKDLGQRESASLFMTLLAAFNVLLYRYTGQDDILVGLPVTNRQRAEVRDLIGFFLNTMVLRTDLKGEPGFRDLLRRVRETVQDAFAHPDLPFEKLVQELQPERDMSRTPLFSVMFTLTDHAFSNPEPPGKTELRVDFLSMKDQSAKFDLTLSLDLAGRELRTMFGYNADLFDAATIVRMAGHFQTLLEGIVAHSDQRIADLPLLTAAERQQILVEWNATPLPSPHAPRSSAENGGSEGGCIHQLFEAQAGKTPEAVALVFENQQLTYRELNERANQLAHTLQKLGVGPDILVGICVERSLEMVVGLLGILKAGGAYVPLDPNYPKERLAYIVENANFSVLLTQEHLREHLPKDVEHIVNLNSNQEAIAQESTDNPFSGVQVNNLAYVIYTSGSTGRPKGVLVAHRGIGNLAEAQAQAFGIQSDSRVLQFASFNFDASLSEISSTILRGATLCLAPQDSLLPGEPLVELLRELNITVVTLPPSVLAILPANGLPALQTVVSAGEACSTELVKRWGNERRFLNAYGPTETTVCATMALLDYRDPFPAHIGRPIANAQAYILDAHFQPAPVGVSGELYIGGDGLARGYLNRPDLTAEKFIPNPFAALPIGCADGEGWGGTRLYKTGDLARWLPDGNIEFLGRIDQQVKIRGFRIELGEIETVLSQHPDVREAVALVREDEPGNPLAGAGKRLVAYVVAKQTPSIEELRSHLKARLPEYMLPAAFVFLAQLPLTPNGKVDRKALPAPSEERPELAREYRPPRTQVEQTLVDIWKEILRVERVGTHDNFFELGGHSLLATQVISRIRKAFNSELPLRTLFQAPTVAELAQSIEPAQQPNIPALLPASRPEKIPLSFAQQRLWFIDQLEPGNTAYNIFAALRLRGPLDVTALEQGFKQIVRRHESLRTTFQSVDGEPRQVIAADMPVSLPLTDLSALSEVERETEAQRLALAESRRPFDLSSGPLVRCTLLRLGDAEHVLLLTMHHIISDGWSISVLFREAILISQAYAAGQEASLPALPLQYADFAIWQRDWLQDEVLKRQLNYWKKQLADAPAALELPTDHPRPTVQTYHGKCMDVALPQELSNALQSFSRQENTTLFMTLLAAFQVLLSRYSGQTDIVVGSPVANRNRAETEGLIGFFVNTLALRADLSGNPSFHEALKRVREACLDAYDHQDLPFEKLVDEVQVRRDMSRNPLFQAMFVLQNTPGGEINLPGLTLSFLPIENETAKFDLTLSLTETEQGLAGTLEYNTDLFEPPTIARLLGHFQMLLEGIVADRQQRLSELPLLTAAERQQILVEWNATTPLPSPHFPRSSAENGGSEGSCIHELFEAQAGKTPEAVALTFEGRQLTYRELNGRANQLAHYLQKQSVGPDALVGICMERSLEMIVGLLGILKAGGAYVPLDPQYPQERLEYMLADSHVAIILTQEWLGDYIPQGAYQIVFLDRDWPTIAQQDAVDLDSGVVSKNLAYVIYTSGSTGKPKGVQIEHQGLLNLVFWHQQAFAVSASDRATQVAGPSFDASVWEIWPYLSIGASIHIPNEQTRALPEQLRDWLVEEAITISFLPTPLAELMLLLEWPARSALRILLVGGEKLNHYPDPSLPFTLINNYGPTENTVVTSSGHVSYTEQVDSAPTIGRPISNVFVYLCDQSMQIVPVGVPGELHVGGVSLARGYLNRADLTAEKFIPNPFSLEPGARIYKTGDLARYLPDGNIEYLGRIDHQVKIRGFRIELGEIESVLGQHPAVHEAVVITREDQPGEKRLVAYVTAKQALSVDELRGHLKMRLPEYMLPAAFVFLDQLPITPNGKVDRKALPAPSGEQPESGILWTAPRTPTEQQLADIWAIVLRLKQVGIYDDFFELGGDSLRSLQVIALARQAGIHLIPRQIFQQRTIAELAAVANTTPAIRAEQGIVTGPVPLTPNQRWFLERNLPHPEQWLIYFEVEVLVPLVPEWLKQVAQALFRHHDALRSRFVCEANIWQQFITEPDERTPFISINLSGLPEAEQNTAMQTTASQLQNSLSLAEGPLVQAVHFDLGKKRPGRLFFIMHHLIGDAYSLQILATDSKTAYQQLVRGEAIELGSKTTSYKEWSERLSAYARSADSRQELDYWVSLPWERIVCVPLDAPAETGDTIESAHTLTISLSKDETNALLKAHPTALLETLLTAFGQTLAHLTQSPYILFTLIINGREAIFEDIDLARTVGLFALGHSVILDMTDAQTPEKALSTVREQLARIPNRGITHGMLRLIESEDVKNKLKKWDEYTNHNKVVFNYVPPMTDILPSDAPVRLAQGIDLSENSDNDRDCVLNCTTSILKDQLVFNWGYSSNLHRSGTIEAIAQFYLDALRAM
jgi:amino acid adenylation domain-containing protein/non-ribosomal peptide synthase protein (TIGR01720 family)